MTQTRVTGTEAAPPQDGTVEDTPIGPQNGKPAPEQQGNGSFWSLGRKFAAIMALALILCFGPVLTYTVIEKRNTLFDLAVANNATISALIADRAGGGLRWGRVEAIQDAYKRFAEAKDSTIANIRTYDNSGKVITDYKSPKLSTFDMSKVLEANKPALDAGKIARQVTAHHAVIAVPVTYGKAKSRVGTMVIAWSLDALDRDLKDSLMRQIGISIGVVIGLIVLIILVFKRSIERPLKTMISAMERLVSGDKGFEIPLQNKRDDIGAMARMVNVFKNNALELDQVSEERAQAAAEKAEQERRAAAEKAEQEQHAAAEKAEQERRAAAEKRELLLQFSADFEKSIKGVADQVSTSTEQLRDTAQSMSSTAEETSSQSQTVAAASEQAYTNVQTVASAAEQLSASVAEIGGQVDQSTRIAGNAVAQAEQTNDQIQELAEAAQKIDEVVKLISDIAAQTNLLALNATIEAARAGDAGKGFAVVASEVKSLANQTAKATEEIAAQISSVQGATTNAVSAIQAISTVIGEISEISTAVAAAVEEQGAATQEIARNVQDVAAGTQEVSSNISGVTKAAAETGASANEVLVAAGELSQQSETLATEVDKFLAQVRAG